MDRLRRAVPDVIAFTTWERTLVVWTDRGRARPSKHFRRLLKLAGVWKGVAHSMGFVSVLRNYLKRHYRNVPSKRDLHRQLSLFTFLPKGESRKRWLRSLGISVNLVSDVRWNWRICPQNHSDTQESYFMDLIYADFEIVVDSNRNWWAEEDEYEEYEDYDDDWMDDFWEPPSPMNDPHYEACDA